MMAADIEVGSGLGYIEGLRSHLEEQKLSSKSVRHAAVQSLVDIFQN